MEHSAPTKPFRCPILLRSIVRAHDPISSIESIVFDYLERYDHLAQTIGITSKFLPEQHDLYINHRGVKININYELNNVPPVKFKVDDELRNEIYSVADSQRRLLGLNEPGAIELIPALIQRGVRIFFLDFHSSNIW